MFHKGIYHRSGLEIFVYINCILQKPRRDLRNLSVISGCRIGPNLITASALDSMLSSPKVKVKVKVKVTAY